MRNDGDFNRRGFITKTGAVLTAAGLGGMVSGCQTMETKMSQVEPSWMKGGLIAKNDVVLFQGDSITDAGRKRESAGTANNEAALGSGYAGLAAVELLADRPDDGLKIFNRGVSGNKVFQLADRWQSDCLDIKPNVLSILIGVNDLWHTLNGTYKGTVEIYERDYRALLDRTMAALPKVKLIICEPFVLKTGAVTDKWFPEFDNYRAAAKRVADTYHATFVPFQTMFDTAVKFVAADHLTRDGVHPAATGASLMAYNWLKAANGKA